MRETVRTVTPHTPLRSVLRQQAVFEGRGVFFFFYSTRELGRFIGGGDDCMVDIIITRTDYANWVMIFYID